MDEPTFDPIAVEPDEAEEFVATTVAMVAVDLIKRDHLATVAKLRTLANDAQRKADEAAALEMVGNQSFWLGFKDGLLRSITTIEGRDHSPSS